MTGHDRASDEHWLTYIEAAKLLGISPEAVRAIARRQKWPRQSANAIGRAVRILVPADRLRPVMANGHSGLARWPRPVTHNSQEDNGQRSRPVVNGHDQRAAELREMAEILM